MRVHGAKTQPPGTFQLKARHQNATARLNEEAAGAADDVRMRDAPLQPIAPYAETSAGSSPSVV
jgi:hypothetical protein